MIPSDTTDLIVAQSTHAGETGKNNEDRAVVAAFRESAGAAEAVTLAMVADGIGGHAAGEIASDLAVRSAYDHFSQADAHDPLGTLQAALLAANEAIYERARSEPTLQGMGSTAVVAVVVGRRLYGAHVGDSRMYLIRGESIQQLTVDHTWVQEAIGAGLLTREEARRHPNRHVIRRYLGHDLSNPIDVRLQFAPGDDDEQMQRNQGLALQNGDRLLLCSDGLTDLVEDDEIRAMVVQHPPQAAVEQLVLLARQRGGFDNITVILLKTPGKPRPSQLAAPTVQVQVSPGPARAVPGRVGPAPARQSRRRLSALVLVALGLAAFLGLLAVGLFAALYFRASRQLTPTAPVITLTSIAPPALPAAIFTETPAGVITAPPAVLATPAPTAGLGLTVTPAATPTPQPFVTITSDVIVRFKPDPDAPEVGSLLAGSTSYVAGRDPTGQWWYIEYPSGTSSRGWIYQYLSTLTGEVSAIPVVDESGTPIVPATNTLSPTGAGTAGPTVTPQG